MGYGWPKENGTEHAVVFLMTVLLLSCAEAKSSAKIDPIQKPSALSPTRQLSIDEYPQFNDDLNFENMLLALDRQIERYLELPLSGHIQLGNIIYPKVMALDSLRAFRRIVSSTLNCFESQKSEFLQQGCIDTANQEIQRQFNVFVPYLEAGDPNYGQPKPAFFTAYYTPQLKASRSKTNIYKHAVYAKPRQSRLVTSTREQIDFDEKLVGRNLELFYVDNLFDIYLLHVQGGGRAVFASKNEAAIYVSYDGTNTQSFRFISKYMMEKGYITNPSVEAQRDFLQDNPDKQREVFRYSPGYVYFKRVNTPPLGNDNVPLTDNRSLATDSDRYGFKGLLAFVKAERPVDNGGKKIKGPIRFREFSRFFLDQDTGGAIRGKARADLYFGEGEYAELAAYNIQNRGDIYFLMLKPEVRSQAINNNEDF